MENNEAKGFEMYAVMWSKKKNDGTDAVGDFYSICVEYDEAVAEFDEIIKRDDIECALVSRITDATEPHWVAG